MRASKLRLPDNTAAATTIVFNDGLLDRRRERTGIADARRATVTDEIEAELVEIRLQTGLVQIIADDARAGRERSLDDRVHRQTAFDRLPGEQPGGQHHAGIRRVGAAGDGCNQNRAVANFTFQRPSSRRDVIGRRMIVRHFGFRLRIGILQPRFLG